MARLVLDTNSPMRWTAPRAFVAKFGKAYKTTYQQSENNHYFAFSSTWVEREISAGNLDGKWRGIFAAHEEGKKLAAEATLEDFKPVKKTPFRFARLSARNKRKYRALQAAVKSGDVSESELRAWRRSLKGEKTSAYYDCKNVLRGPRPVEAPPEAPRVTAANARLSGGITKPINAKNDWLGVEIECNVDMNKCEVYGEGVSIETFLKHEGCIYYEAGDDGSLRKLQAIEGEDWKTVEITQLCRVGNFAPLDKLCAALKKLGARVDSHCGLHVHIDARQWVVGTEYRTGIGDNAPDDESRGLLMERAKRLRNILPLMLAMQHPNRRANQHCYPDMNSFAHNETGRTARYYAINVLAFNKHNTVEVRLHSGTTNADKIKHWCALLWAAWTCETWTPLEVSGPVDDTPLGGYANPVKNYLHLVEEAKLNLSLPESTWQYITERTALFALPVKEISRKNKPGVTYADDDVEAVIINGMVDHAFYEELLAKITSVSDEMPLEDFVALEESIRSPETLTKLQSKWLSDYTSEALDTFRNKKSDAFFTLRRDMRVHDFHIKAINDAENITQLDSAYDLAYRAKLKNSTSLEYMSDNTWKVVNFRYEVRKFELRKTKTEPVKVQDADAFLAAEQYNPFVNARDLLTPTPTPTPFIPAHYRGLSLESLLRMREDRIRRGQGVSTINLAINNHAENYGRFVLNHPNSLVDVTRFLEQFSLLRTSDEQAVQYV